MSPDLHTFVGAYALDALDDQERAEFDRHLATCETCRIEVTELVETAARLGAAAQAVPPPALRARVLDAVARSPQERPPVVSLQSRRRRSWTTTVLGVAAALLAVLGVGVGISQYAENRDLREQQAATSEEEALVADVLSADDKVAYDSRRPSGPRLSVVASRKQDAAVVSLRDLPDLAVGRSYQVWRQTERGFESAGVMHSSDISRDRATMLLDDLSGTRAVAVTEEPAGGSPQPTSEPLVDVALPA